MDVLRQWRRFLRTRDGRMSCVVVFACGLALAALIGRTFIAPAAEYKLDFGRASWIESSDASPAGYFRKSLYVPGAVTRAWVEVAATGSYSLYINDILVAKRSFPGVTVSGAYDVKRLLTPGKNVLGIYVPAGYGTSQAKVIVRGFYAISSSPLQEFVSDSTWKAAGTPNGLPGSYPWSSPRLDDRFWSDAREAHSGRRFSTLQPVEVDPWLFAAPSQARWITAASGAAGNVVFGSTLRVPRWHRTVWLQIAANGGYDLIVNGSIAATQPVEPQAMIIGPQAPLLIAPGDLRSEARAPKVSTPNGGRPGAETPSVIPPGPRTAAAPVPARDTLAIPQRPQTGAIVSMPDLADMMPPLEVQAAQTVPLPTVFGTSRAVPLLVAYNITKYVRAGTNSLRIVVRPDNGPALLLADGYVELDDSVRRTFHSDRAWHTSQAESQASHSIEAAALVVGRSSDSLWGPLPQVPANETVLPDSNISLLSYWALTTLIVVMFTILLWMLVPALVSPNLRALVRLWVYDAGVQLAIIGIIASLWVLSFDVRVSPDWCFRPVVALALIAVLLSSKLLLILPRHLGPGNNGLSTKRFRTILTNKRAAIAVAIITGIGFLVRAHGLLEASISHDEATIIAYARGVLASGYPHLVAGSYRKLMSTYELLAYTTAFSSLLFGTSEWAYRLPSLFFGSLAIALIGLVGRRLMDWRVGLSAALIYAFLPTPIGWARDLCYPSQEAFFALLTFWLFFEAVRGKDISYPALRAAAVSFLLAYFTWEGSGFILPSLFLGILAVRWPDIQWMKDRHLWRCFLVVSGVIVLQLCYRAVVKIPDYLGVIYALSELTTPSLAFLQTLVFDPFFYVRNLLLSENLVLLSALALGGGIVLWKNPAIKYLYVLLLSMVGSYTFFLPNYATRYCFSAIFLLVLAGCSVFYEAYDRIRAWMIRTGLSSAGVLATGTVAIFGVLLVLSANPFILQTYRLSAVPQKPAQFARLGIKSEPDYRRAARYVLAHAAPTDLVITRTPQVFDFYAGGARANYSINSLLGARMYYDGGSEWPFYGDKHMGLPSICDEEELDNVVSSDQRTWLIRPTYGVKGFDRVAVTSFLRTRGRVMFEGAHQQVILLTGIGRGGMREAAR